MKQFFCELILSCVLASPGAKPLDELTYGSVLYSYFQEDYQQALLDTMVAESQGRLGEDPVRFELAKGSFAFSERMYELARQTFAGVDPAELTEIDRMRLAFHLAREYHRRGDFSGMLAELDVIEFDRTWRGRQLYHPEVEYMRAEAAIATGNFELAEQFLERLEEGDPLLAYGLFNLGVAYREADLLTQSQRAFERLADMKAEDDEARDLAQRARLALAYVARAQQATTGAAAVLDDLPAEGRYQDVALAAYGGLAMDNEDYELAARIWLTLQNQSYWTTSTAQARLAFPVSLERLASRQMALEQYRQAEQSFENRLALLTDLSVQAQDPQWVRGLLMVFSSPDQDDQRMADLVDRWRQQLGHTDWLEWLATEDTHQVLMEWRELLTMRDWLDQLPGELAAFEEVAGERRRRSASARSLIEDEALKARRTSLEDSIMVQARELDVLNRSVPERSLEWMGRLANDDERRVLDELDQMRQMVRNHMSGSEQARWLRRIARLEGTVFWQIVDERASRTRVLTRQHQENVALLEEVDARVARVSRAEAEFVAGVETDFLAFADRAEVLTTDVVSALTHREVALAGELQRGMEREMKEVQQYLLVTRIGIARATDQLSMESDTVEGE